MAWPFVWEAPAVVPRELLLFAGGRPHRLDLSTLGDHRPIVTRIGMQLRPLCVYMCTCVYVSVREGARERDRRSGAGAICTCMQTRSHTHTYALTYIHTDTHSLTHLLTHSLTCSDATTGLALRLRASAEGGTVVIKIRGCAHILSTLSIHTHMHTHTHTHTLSLSLLCRHTHARIHMPPPHLMPSRSLALSLCLSLAHTVPHSRSVAL
jgi:hypothetical protein